MKGKALRAALDALRREMGAFIRGNPKRVSDLIERKNRLWRRHETD